MAGVLSDAATRALPQHRACIRRGRGMSKITNVLKRVDRALAPEPAITPADGGTAYSQATVLHPPRWTLSPCVTLPIDMMITLQRRLRVALPEVASPVIQIAASGPGEGVTTVAQNLALVLSRDVGARVLLVQSKAAPGTAAAVPTLQQAVAATGEIGPAITASDHPRLFAAWLGAAPADRAAAEPDAVFKALRAAFDFVVIDSGNVSGWLNEQAFCRLTDAVLLVVQAERTPWALVEQTLEALSFMGAPVKGVVLNRRRRYIPKRLLRFL